MAHMMWSIAIYFGEHFEKTVSYTDPTSDLAVYINDLGRFSYFTSLRASPIH